MRWLFGVLLCSGLTEAIHAADVVATPAQLEAAKAAFGQRVQTAYPGTDPYSQEKFNVFVLKNSVTDDDFKEFKDLPFPFRLYLNGGIAGDGAIKNMAHLKNLTGLNAAGTRISSKGLQDIPLLSGLTMLGLDRFQATDEAFKVLNAVGKLHLLANLRAAGGKRPAKLTDVESIDLHSLFKVNDEALKQLSACSNVKIMDLGGTGITDAGLKELAHFPSLTLLKLVSKPEHVTESGVSELQKALPKLKIELK